MSEQKKLTAKQIRIYAEGADYLHINALKDFQGNFKSLTRENADRLKKLIEKRFISPFFVWENKDGNKMLLDGHQRSKVIPQMIADGYEFRPCNRKGEFIDQETNTFPVIYVYAETEQEARENLLMISSQHGEFDDIDGFTEELDNEILEAARLVDQELSIITPDFNLSTEEEQGKLDELVPKIIICPHCKEAFDAREM